jgi:integrase
MSSGTTLDVKVWGVRVYKGKRRSTYTVRWRVHGRDQQRTFDTRKLADSFRATLLVGVRNGEPFDRRTGLPVRSKQREDTKWLEHAMAFVDMKWPHASPRHRKGLAEGLVTATCAALQAGGPDSAVLRAALIHWAFNSGARGRIHDNNQAPTEWAEAIRWARHRSPTLNELAEPAVMRRVLDALALKLDGSPASPSTVARKRSALYSALEYAVEVGSLSSNPMDKVRWTPPQHTDVVDRRVVVNPDQARALLAEVRRIYPSLEAFYGCLYYGGLRPSEVRHLLVSDLHLPDDEDAWGTLELLGSTQTAGALWTDTGVSTEDRALKHRARRATRLAPAPPELVDLLHYHIQEFPPGVRGRLFVARAGRAGVPVTPPFASPQSMGVVYRVWDRARRAAFTDAEYASPLAKRPYDLRHAAVSLWLNAGVPATQVAEWAGHSVNVLLRVYAKCVVGQDEASRQRVQAALGGPRYG